MKKLLSFLLVLCVAFTMSGTAAFAQGIVGEGEAPTLTVLVQPTATIIDMRTNDFTRWMEEQTGVKIEWTVLESDAAETVSLMLSSGEKLPDILMVQLTKEQQALYGSQGVLLPLNDLVGDCAPNIAKAYEDYPMYAATSACADGNIYYISAYEECFHCTAAQKMWVNRTWLDNLGLDMPSTTEEFHNMLLAFRDQDANGNGDAGDEIPLSTYHNGWHTDVEAFLMSAFIYDDGQDRLFVRDGVVDAAFTQDAFRQGLKYIHRLYADGLIDPNAFVQDQASIKALCSDTVRVGAVPAGHTGEFLDTDNANIFQYEACNPLTGPEGVSVCGHFPSVAKESDGAALSADCSNPELAMRWLNFLFSEEATISSQYGMKGRDWDYNTDENVLGLNDKPALFTTWGKTPVYYKTQLQEAWHHTSPFLLVDHIFAGMAVLGGDGYDLEKVIYDATKDYVSHFPEQICANLTFSDEDAAYIASVQTMINDYVEQMICEFIMGTSDIEDDAAWDAYIQRLKAMDLERYLAVMQKGFDAQQALIASLAQ